jgi:polyphosphate kinase
MRKDLYLQGYTQNREQSWLRFDDRVLNEARDKSVPLLERLKFVSIYTSNLNEFFMVRVGSLYDVKRIHFGDVDNKSGLTAKGQLDMIYRESQKSFAKRDEVYRDLRRKLRKEGISDLSMDQCSKSEQKFLRKYFKRKVAPYLNAQIVDTHHPFPNLQSGVTQIGALLKDRGHGVFAFVAVPAALPAIVMLPGKKVRFVHLEDIVQANIDSLYGDADIIESLKLKITRNAEVNPDDDAFDDIVDYRKKMMKVLSQRRRSAVVRLECSAKPSLHFKRYLFEHLNIDEQKLFVSDTPMDLRYGFSLGSLLPPETAAKFSYVPYTPKLSVQFNYRQRLFNQIQKHDVLLSYPYESMDPFLLLVREAANDPAVLSIKITIYRLAKKAKLVDYLCQAAENGKEVVALIELKARFDEQNNIDYSERLEDSGCKVLYGFEDYKVHSKICLITRSGSRGLQYVAQIATGNFNENTAKQYTDLSYLTSNPGIVRDSVAFFRNMMIGRLDGSYHSLLVAPVSLKSTLIRLIERETAKKEKGRILAKVNAITDEDLIEKLSEASRAGVKITLIVRGICCLLPGIPGHTDSITIRSIVGRYLEHSRIYVFGEGKSERMYISSADFMTRNTEHRVEIAAPVADADIRQRIRFYLDFCLKDNVKARQLDSTGRWHHIKDDQPPFDCQQELMDTTAGSKQSLPTGVRVKAPVSVFETRFHRNAKRKKTGQ